MNHADRLNQIADTGDVTLWPLLCDDLRAAAKHISQLHDAILDAHIVMGEGMSDGLPTWPEPAELLVRSAKEWRAEYYELLNDNNYQGE